MSYTPDETLSINHGIFKGRINRLLLEALARAPNDLAKFCLISQEFQRPGTEIATAPQLTFKLRLEHNRCYLEATKYFMSQCFRSPSHTSTDLSSSFSSLEIANTNEILLTFAELKTLIDHGHYFSNAQIPLDASVGFIFAQLVALCIQLANQLNNLALLPILLLFSMIVLYTMFQRAYFLVKGLPCPAFNAPEIILAAKEWVALLFGLSATDLFKQILPASLSALAGTGGAAGFVTLLTIWNLVAEPRTPSMNDITTIVKKTLPLAGIFSLLLYCDGLIQDTVLNKTQKQVNTNFLFALGLPGAKVVTQKVIEDILPAFYRLLAQLFAWLWDKINRRDDESLSLLRH